MSSCVVKRLVITRWSLKGINKHSRAETMTVSLTLLFEFFRPYRKKVRLESIP